MTGGEPAREPVSELVAQSLSRWGLSAPAVVFLELHRPIAFAAGQCAIFFQPLLGFVIGDQNALQFSHWLANEDCITRMILRLTGKQQASSLPQSPSVLRRRDRSADDRWPSAGEERV